MKYTPIILLLFAGALLLLTACAAPEALYSEPAFKPYADTGNGKIIGRACVKNRRGDMVCAARREVVLVPATPFSTALYKENNLKGDGIIGGNYQRHIKTAVADAEGRFSFENLPDGTYYIGCPIQWDFVMEHRTRPVHEYGKTMVTIDGEGTVEVELSKDG